MQKQIPQQKSKGNKMSEKKTTTSNEFQRDRVIGFVSGSEEKQKEHLRERVLIHIFERFEHRIPEDFEGYLLKV